MTNIYIESIFMAWGSILSNKMRSLLTMLGIIIGVCAVIVIVGLGNGMQKQLYLPEPHNDFIFATWCEEMGLIGALIIIAIFAFLIWRGFYIARSSPDRMGMLLATGITAKLAIQTLMNLCVVTGIMPVTGAALPFFSYGGTALAVQLAEVGIVLSVSRQMR